MLGTQAIDARTNAHTHQIVDDDAPIWKLCAAGHLDDVNRLLSQGVATVVDIDSCGRTLLHVSAYP